jgi:hypothetical protein
VEAPIVKGAVGVSSVTPRPAKRAHEPRLNGLSTIEVAVMLCSIRSVRCCLRARKS